MSINDIDPKEEEGIRTEQKSPESEPPKTMDEEWAETLKIKFDPTQVNQTPPPLPGDGGQYSPDSGTPTNDAPNAGNYGGQFDPRYAGPFKNNTMASKEMRDNYEPMPPTYLIWSILITIFCCFIPGIFAIVYSSQVSSRYYAGDIEGAKRSSRNAEIWIIVSFVLGVIATTLWLPISIING